MKRLREVFKSEAGFTLIELLVVIAVLGVLAGIAVPRLSGVKERAEIASGKSALGTINTTMGLYYAENDHYPTGDAAALATALGTYVDNYDELISGWTVTYTPEASPSVSGEPQTFSIEITNGTSTVTIDQSGSITES